MKKNRVLNLIAIVMATVALSSGCSLNKTKNGKMRDITTTELVHEMGIGINLGNTFESCGDWIDGSSVKNYETAWGSPVITKEMIQGYADEGFGVLRIPVAWSNMMEDNYTINADYLARVKEVVDWALESDLYVILNIHWDGGWWEKFPTDKEECTEKYTRIWTQLCDAFKNYSDYLMFESLNEEGCWNEVWNQYGGTDGKEEAYGLLNEINQEFVNIVRDSGGNNAERHLLIAGYATDVELTCDDLFEMPNDEENRCAVSVHYYTPPTFCVIDKDASWGKARSTWGSPTDYAQLDKYMNMMQDNFVNDGIPVIIGEYGVTTSNKTEETVRQYLSAVCEAAYSRNLCPVLWDVTDAFYDRTQCQMKDDTLMEQLLAAKDSEDNLDS